MTDTMFYNRIVSAGISRDELMGVIKEYRSSLTVKILRIQSRLTGVSMPDILSVVADRWSVDPLDVIGHSRKDKHNFPRHAFCYLSWYLLGCTFNEIGEFLNGRDHTTALHGKRTAIDLMQTNPVFLDNISFCIEALSNDRMCF